MTIRKKLLFLLLSVSLIPLVAYFVLDISFSRIVRGRIQKTLTSTVQDRTRETLIQTIDNYQEKLTISAQAVRYGLLHYADKAQRIFGPANIKPDSPDTSRYIIQLSPVDMSNEAQRYKLLKQPVGKDYTIDFNSQFIHSAADRPGDLLRNHLPQLTGICKEIYSLNPGTKLWTYTVLNDGTVALYPSPGFWPFEAGHDLRRESWYVKARTSEQLTPTPRIEPLTGKTVMTVAVPLFENNGSFGGVIAMDIDLNSVLDNMELTEPWKAVENAGGTPELVSTEVGKIQAFNHLTPADTFEADEAADAATTSDYDGLVLPGGVANPDFLRQNASAVQFAKSFFDSGRPVASL